MQRERVRKTRPKSIKRIAGGKLDLFLQIKEDINLEIIDHEFVNSHLGHQIIDSADVT